MNTAFFELYDVAPPSTLFMMEEDLFYFAKDREGRYVYANQLPQICFELSAPEQLLGKTDLDFFDEILAHNWRQEELAIMTHGQSQKNRLIVVGQQGGRLQWLFASKAPLRNRIGQIVGVEGIFRDAETLLKTLEPFRQFSNIIEHIQHNYFTEIGIAELARLSSMSITTFERHFQRHFSCSPKTYITRLRIQEACRRLVAGNHIKRVAHDLGFCDQSHFTKAFKQLMGLPPGEYQQHQLAHSKRHILAIADE